MTKKIINLYLFGLYLIFFINFLKLNQKIPKEVIDVISESSSILKDSKPLGDLGEITINQIFSQVGFVDFSSIFTTSNVVVGAVQLISAGFVFKMLVNTFADKVYPMDTLSLYKTEKEKLILINQI